MAEYLSYEPFSEEELRAMAQTQISPGYESRLADLERAVRRQEAAYQTQIKNLTPQYDQRAQEIASNLALHTKEIGDAALSRGFGRSSYVTDLMAKAQRDANQSLETLRLQQQSAADAINDKIDELYDELYAQQGRLTQEKEQKILSQIDSLRREQMERQFEVEKFNLEMEQRRKEQEALENYRKEQLRLQSAKLNSSSGGSSKSSKSSSSSSSGSTISKGTTIGPVYTPNYISTGTSTTKRGNSF